MPHDVRALPAYFNTDADFRAFVAGITAQLTACGLVNVTTSNEINSATVLKPGAANTFMGAQIWRFNDTLQATKPWFIRVSYGSGAAADRPRMVMAPGTSSDLNANNNPGGPVFAMPSPGPTASKTAGATLNSYMWGNGSAIAVMLNFDPANSAYGMAQLIERPMVDGARSGEGIYAGSFNDYAGSNTNQGIFVKWSDVTAPAAGAVNTSGIWVPLGGGAAAGHPLVAGSQAGVETAMCPGILPVGGKIGLCTGFASYKTSQLTALTPLDVNTNEGIIQYNPLGGVNIFMGAWLINGANPGAPGIAIRWD